jgi:hypothetical protein
MPNNSIIRGHHRGPVKEIKDRLKGWCELVEVDEFPTLKLCCCCHSTTEKDKYDDKVVNSVLRCINNECRTTIDKDMNGAATIYMLLTKMIQNELWPEPFCHPSRI